MPDNFLSPLFYTISHFLSYFFFSGNILYNCHLCQIVEETPALNSIDEKDIFLKHWSYLVSLINTAELFVSTFQIALYLFNLRKYFPALWRSMLNCQRIHFMSSKKLRYCTTCMTDLAPKRPSAIFLLGAFWEIFDNLSKPLLLN